MFKVLALGVETRSSLTYLDSDYHVSVLFWYSLTHAKSVSLVEENSAVCVEYQDIAKCTVGILLSFKRQAVRKKPLKWAKKNTKCSVRVISFLHCLQTFTTLIIIQKKFLSIEI